MPDSGKDAWPVDTVVAGGTVDWDCVWCQRLTSHVVRADWLPNVDPDDTFETAPLLREGLTFALAECRVCAGPLLVGWQSLVDLDEAEPDLLECVQLYPPREMGGIPEACPPSVRQWLDEAHACRLTSSTPQ